MALATELRVKRLLCLGAHCDDIEIGCGGTILKLINANPDIDITWVVFTSTTERRLEAERGAQQFCNGAANLSIQVHDFRDGFLPYHGEAVKDAFEAIKAQCDPDLILTHYRHDLHQDHAKISELTWNTWRNHLIWEYEIPKWDGDLGQPNGFVHLSREQAQHKIALLQAIYNSQACKQWFTDDLFHSLLRLRGMEANSPSQLAEAFYVKKVTLLPISP